MDTRSVTTKARCSFPLLADPESYRPSDWDLVTDRPKREYWVGLFGRHFPHLLEEAYAEGLDQGQPAQGVRARIDQAKDKFDGYLRRIATDPAGVAERIDTLEICRERERILRECGFADPYRLAKERENQTALAVLPRLFEQLDGLTEGARAERIIRGVFAGNIYDLGATETLKLFAGPSAEEAGDATNFFERTLANLKPRPWLFDNLGPWLDRFNDGRDGVEGKVVEGNGGPAVPQSRLVSNIDPPYPPYRCAVLFVDNAGSDIVLGMIPFARELLRGGTEVILTANTHPSLNDITHDELVAMVDGIGRWDPIIGGALESGTLELVGSGNGIPLIDLSECSGGLCDAVERRGVDLVVLEGMGRALESNFFAQFTCDCLKIAMVKDAGVAQWVGGEVYDLVLKFEST